MSQAIPSGHLQSIDYSHADQITILDEIHGTHTITEPVLLDLLRDPSFQRLVRINQHGISALLGFTAKVSRFEHSVGAFLLVRLVGGALDEQVAGLLHDVSHTAMSHVVDFTLTKPGEGSYHEVHKMRYVETTSIPQILRKHGYADLRPLHEELFPLVEQDAPRLCADRLDYALRDAVAFGALSRDDARKVIASLTAAPSASAPDRVLALRDVPIALHLSRSYMSCDRDVWGNAAHSELYAETASLIKAAISRGAISDDELWTLSDRELWEKMRREATAEEQQTMRRLEEESLPDESGLTISRQAKIRTIDPDIFSESPETTTYPLSSVLPSYAAERSDYLKARYALYAPA